MAMDKIRVLVVDDSSFMRRMVTEIIQSSRKFCVIDTATNGKEALEKIAALKPDVITMDIEMPVMNGLEALEQIMKRFPTPVVMLSSHTTHGAKETLRSLELGAVDFVCKPSGSVSLDIEAVKLLLRAKLRIAASARVFRQDATPKPPVIKKAPLRQEPQASSKWVVAIASSTGGPRALETIIPQLPAALPASVLVVQHMPHGFTAAMAERLNSLSAVEVKEAADGDDIIDGRVLIAPGGKHLLVRSGSRVSTTDDPPIMGVRPAADILMLSAAKIFGASALGVILTGMGRDGADGIAAIHQAGGVTIAEDESTCVVYGMPRAAVEQGGVDKSLPLDRIAGNIVSSLNRRQSNAPALSAVGAPR
jgi:two-component system chemotaxis response regulator CheB